MNECPDNEDYAASVLESASLLRGQPLWDGLDQWLPEAEAQ